MICGLLGEKLGHSYSPQIHKDLGGYPYHLFEKTPEELEGFLLSGAFTGINVTIPYKKSVIPYLTELSPMAARLGAVNTIVRREDGSLIGHNTDYFGLKMLITQSCISLNGKKVLVLGSGGASNTAVAVVSDLGGNPVVISRSGPDHYGNLHLHQDASVIINTTPVGMYPKVGVSPIDLTLFHALEGAFDLIFNPARTKLLLDAMKLGIPAFNGLLMLVAQAWESAQWFTGKAIDSQCITDIYRRLRLQTENIILIGMPGCGKSTIACALAERTSRSVMDSDAEIVKEHQMSIPEIFASYGEETFRQMEAAVLERLGKSSGLIIATGGGCVTRSENAPALQQNGRIYWIKRKLDDLPTEGRPLSMIHSAQELYSKRQPMYEAFADYIIENNASVEDAVERILTQWENIE